MRFVLRWPNFNSIHPCVLRHMYLYVWGSPGILMIPGSHCCRLDVHMYYPLRSWSRSMLLQASFKSWLICTYVFSQVTAIVMEAWIKSLAVFPFSRHIYLLYMIYAYPIHHTCHIYKYSNFPEYSWVVEQLSSMPEALGSNPALKRERKQPRIPCP